MWQLRKSYVVLMAGLLGAVLAAGARGPRADIPSSGRADLPSFPRVDRAPIPNSWPFQPSDALCADLRDTLRPVGAAVDRPPLRLAPGGIDWPFNDREGEQGGEALQLAPGPAALLGFDGAGAALAEIRAAAGGLSPSEGEALHRDDLPSLESEPAPDPLVPLLPTPSSAPDLRALLAVGVVPALSFIRPIRRRGNCLRRITGAVSERLTSALGLLLIMLWGALRKG